MDKQLARQQYEQEKITKELQEAREKEEKKQESLPLEEVVSQMGSGMIHFPDGPMRFWAVQFFQNAVSLPVPIDYLQVQSQDQGVVSLVNDVMGISLILQYTTSENKDVTFEKVKKGVYGQFRGAGIYAEMIEEGEVEDPVAPVYFTSMRVPVAPGVMYEMLFYSINKNNGKMLVGSYNCFYKDIEKWQNIIKATLSYLDFQ